MKKILFILFLFIGFLAKSQQVNVPYNPSKHVVVNDAVSPAQASPIDGRMMYFDTTNFVWRAFRDTTEVRLVLSGLPNKYRFGNSIIIVDSGGTLQANGTFTNPKNTFWMYRDSTTDGALRKMWLFNDNPLLYTALAPVHIAGTVISVDTSSILATKYWVSSQGFLTNINGLIQAGTNVSITGSGSSISPYVINSSAGSGTLSSVGLTMPAAFTVNNSPLISNGTINVTANGTASQYIQGNGVLNTFPALFNPIAGLGITLSGTYPNITFAVDTSQKFDTVYAKYPLYVPPGTPDSVAIYLSGAHQQGALDSLDWVTFNNKQNAIQFQQATVPFGTLGQFSTFNLGTNLSATQSGSTITINANNAATNNIKWLDTGNHVIAGVGVGTVYKADTGIRVTLSGDTIKLRVIPDTIYAGSGLGSTGTDTLLWGGSVSRNTIEEFHGLYSLTLDSLGAGLFMTQLANKSTLLSTDSVLINDISGKVWKVPSSAIGGGGVNIYNANGIFNSNRYVDAANQTLTIDSLLAMTIALNNNKDLFITDSTQGVKMQIAHSSVSGSFFKGGMEIDAIGVPSGIPYGSLILDSGRTILTDILNNSIVFDNGGAFQPGIIFQPHSGFGLYFNNMPSPITDTTNFKPLVINTSTGQVEQSTNWYGGSGGGGGNSVGRDSVVAITSGTSSTVTSGYNVVQINPASLLSTYTLTLPATWHTSNDLIIVFGGTIASGNPVVTTFSIVNGSGQTLVQAVTPSGTFNSGSAIRYHLVGGNLDYRIN